MNIWALCGTFALAFIGFHFEVTKKRRVKMSVLPSVRLFMTYFQRLIYICEIQYRISLQKVVCQACFPWKVISGTLVLCLRTYMNSCTYRLHLLTDLGDVWFQLTAVEQFCIPWYWWAEILALLKGMKFCPCLHSFFFFRFGWHSVPQVSFMCLLVTWK